MRIYKYTEANRNEAIHSEFHNRITRLNFEKAQILQK